MIDHRTAAHGAFVLRISLGTLALAHGLMKYLVFTPAGTVGFFESIGYPGFLAYLVMGGEILGGLALIAGVYTRTVALLMVPILLGATLQHLPNGWVFTAANGGWEFPAFWTVALIAQALIGPGSFALRLPALKLGSAPVAKAA